MTSPVARTTSAIVTQCAGPLLRRRGRSGNFAWAGRSPRASRFRHADVTSCGWVRAVQWPRRPAVPGRSAAGLAVQKASRAELELVHCGNMQEQSHRSSGERHRRRVKHEPPPSRNDQRSRRCIRASGPCHRRLVLSESFVFLGEKSLERRVLPLSGLQASFVLLYFLTAAMSGITIYRGTDWGNSYKSLE